MRMSRSLLQVTQPIWTGGHFELTVKVGFILTNSICSYPLCQPRTHSILCYLISRITWNTDLSLSSPAAVSCSTESKTFVKVANTFAFTLKLLSYFLKHSAELTGRVVTASEPKKFLSLPVSSSESIWNTGTREDASSATVRSSFDMFFIIL